MKTTVWILSSGMLVNVYKPDLLVIDNTCVWLYVDRRCPYTDAYVCIPVPLGSVWVPDSLVDE